MAHWEQKEDWLHKYEHYEHPRPMKLWHGERFRQLSSFWDPEKEYMLPDWCVHCRAIIPATVIKEATRESHFVALKCTKCCQETICTPRFVKGDPRNQCIIIHEDGWNSFNTASNSIATITVTHSCMTKSERSDSANAKVYSFIPTSQLPKEAPHKYDAFFEPLRD